MKLIVYIALTLTVAAVILFTAEKAPVFGLHPTQNKEALASIDKELSSPVNISTAPTQQEACTSSFPPDAYAGFLPLIQFGDPIDLPPQPVQEDNISVLKQAGTLVPIGDQLGDVGQYYSQIAPSMVSTLTLENTTPITQTFALTLFEDLGSVAQILEHCTIAPQATLSLQMNNGEMWLLQHNQQTSVEPVCSSSLRREKPRQSQLEPTLHGIYHAIITAGAQDTLAVSVDTASDNNLPTILHRSIDQYQAMPGYLAANTIFIPALLATRNPDNWWDTEIVVQNVTDQTTDVQFRICNDQGRCFANNMATLQAYERRIFLGSHLFWKTGRASCKSAPGGSRLHCRQAHPAAPPTTPKW
jgi:hypothetical protein